MQETEAISIANALIAGCDPATGEVLPRASALRNRKVVEALLLLTNQVTSAREREQRRLERRRQKALPWKTRPSNQGLPWSEDEDEDVSDAFFFGQTVEQIAEEHKRTPVAIVSRLQKHGAIDADAAAQYRVYPPAHQAR